MMTVLAWQVEGDVARLDGAGFAATVCADRPGDGLAKIRLSGAAWPDARLLGVTSAGPTVKAGHSIERHAGGTDLALVGEETPERPIRVDAIWRVTLGTAADQFLLAVDQFVSVRTQRLDSHPDVYIESLVPCVAACRLVNAGRAEFEPLAPSSPPAAGGLSRFSSVPAGDAENGTVSFPQSAAPGCLTFSLTQLPWTYVEMIHPADLRRDEWAWQPARPDGIASVRLRHHLFAVPSLEKGVILRARARGVFMPQGADPAAVARCYCAFAAADPPLGS